MRQEAADFCRDQEFAAFYCVRKEKIQIYVENMAIFLQECGKVWKPVL